MRSPRCFRASSSWVVTDFGSSAIGGRAGRGSGLELRQLALPEGAVGNLGVRNNELRVAQHPIAEAHDIQVQGPRSPAHAGPALAAALRLDRVQVDEQLRGPERGLGDAPLVSMP